MPGTLNGIGTRYVGKSNLSERTGGCPKCNQTVELRSYDTRLWFVVLFIPIIPLGRRKVIDFCPRCTNHRVASPKRWNEARREAIAEAQRRVQEDPGDAEATGQLLGALTQFQYREEADQLAAIMEERFAGDLGVQFNLGMWYAEFRKHEEAYRCFERALTLDPDDTDTRRMVAAAALRRNDPDRARELLAFAMEPGPEQDPVVPAVLADAFHEQGRHAEAAEMYDLAFAADPKMARRSGIRKRARASEAAIGRTESKVPADRRRQIKGIVAVSIIAAAVIAPLAINWRIASRQELHVLNWLPDETVVVIDGGEPITVRSRTRRVTRVPEGKRRAIIRRSDGTDGTVEFEVRNGFWERFRGDSLFVLNVDGAADLIWVETTYQARPAPGGTATQRVHFGESFLEFRGIDFRFRGFPESIELDSNSQVVKRKRVGMLAVPPTEALGAFPGSTTPAQHLDYTEHHLGLTPQDTALMDVYRLMCFGTGEVERMRTFLEAGVCGRPMPTIRATRRRGPSPIC